MKFTIPNDARNLLSIAAQEKQIPRHARNDSFSQRNSALTSFAVCPTSGVGRLLVSSALFLR
jgi:hypothetical protein